MTAIHLNKVQSEISLSSSLLLSSLLSSMQSRGMRQGPLSVANWSALSIHESPTMVNGRRMLQQIVMHLAIRDVVCPFKMVVQRVVIRGRRTVLFLHFMPPGRPECHKYHLHSHYTLSQDVFIAALTSSRNSSPFTHLFKEFPCLWITNHFRQHLFAVAKESGCVVTASDYMERYDEFATSSESMAEQLIYSLCLISKFP